jgi:ferredoxin
MERERPVPSRLAEVLPALGVPVAVRPAETVYGLALDEDPWGGPDAAAARAEPDRVARGLALWARACGAKRAALLVWPNDDVTRVAVEALAPVELAAPYYPVVGPGALAASAEILRAIAHAVDGGRPMITRRVAVTGLVARPRVVEVPIGARVAEVVDAAGGVTDDRARVVVSGRAARTGDAVGKHSGTVVALPRLPASAPIALARAIDACLACRRCTDWCPPAQLGAPPRPHRALRALAHGSEPALAAEAASCTRCGVCALVCPFHLDPRAAYDATDIAFSSPPAADGSPPLRVSRARLLARSDAPQALSQLPTAGEPITLSEVAIPLVGATARVGVGDRVARGQPIAYGPTRVHASIPGVVRALLSDHVVIER